MIVREFNFRTDRPEQLWQLHEAVYPGSRALRERWSWEVDNYPSGKVRIFIATDNGRCVAMTMRLPASLRVDGKDVSACFATNSMVLKDYRGQGLIRELYACAEGSAELQLSKGTAPAMFSRLLDMGYREIFPNSYLTCILAPVSWLVWKITGRSFGKRALPAMVDRFPEFEQVNLSQLETGFVDLDSNYSTTLAQGRDYFRWRYFDIRKKDYCIYQRQIEGRTVSRSVLRFEGRTAYLVDFRWEDNLPDEPQCTIKFVKAFARSKGAVKLITWCTLEALRESLKKEGFWPRKETPHFSYYSPSGGWDQFPWENSHFVHGDGDIDYL